MTVANPRCEYLVNPPAINAEAPRLSWELKSGRRGDVQTAYQIVVADSWASLRSGDKPLWDTGRVPSSETSAIAYGGPKLTPGQEVWWRVRAWDREGHETKWSDASHWSLAVPRDGWHADWIAAPPPPDEATATAAHAFTGLSWVWAPGMDATKEVPAGTEAFRKVFTVPAGKTVRHANFILTADDQFQLYVNGQKAGESDGQFEAWKRPVTVDVGPLLHTGDNTLAISATNDGGAAGLAGILSVQLDPGDRLTVPIDGSWKTISGTPDGWNAVATDDSTWAPAAEVTAVGNDPWGVPGEAKPLVLPPSPMLRKTFDAAHPVRRATLRITALGLYQASLNGQKIGDAVFTPGWTDYKKRVYYQTYDVTPMVRKGSNTLDSVLAGGWAVGYVGFVGHNVYGLGHPRLLAQLDLEYADGTTQTIGTDDSWQTAYGPVKEADLLMGETYDARLDWGANGGWQPAVKDEAWSAPLEAYPGVPVRALMELPARKRTEPTPGAFVFDLGQNMVGWSRLKVNGPAGTKVTLRFAEMLNPDGTVYTTNLRSARCTDTYTLKGGGEEVWEPSFTFHGFRYVEVTGYPGTPPMSAITGVVAHSDAPPVGQFECSNPTVNKLYSNIVWGQRGNFLEVPTDCPQRDERLGWMGDAEVFVRTACDDMDVSAFFNKWMVDVDDGQHANGAFPDVAPAVGAGSGVAAWGDAGVIVPWTMYQVYGDKNVLAQHFDAMAKWIGYLEQHSDRLIRPDEGYGDWLSIHADTPKGLLATAYFAHSTALVAQAAQALGNEADAAHYTDLFNRIRAAFQQAYIGADGHVKGDTQTGYVLSLAFNLMPDGLRPAAAKFLADDIEQHGWHLSTGFIGTGLLNPTLTANGLTDVAYKLLLQDSFPGWLFSIKQGATTIWERWDGWTPDKGFQDPGMNSFNHYSFGAVGQWMFSTVAGIDSDGPGFRRVVIHPRPGGGLTHAKASYHSVNGEIDSSWNLDDGFHLDVTIPANTTATVYIPATGADRVTEGDSSAAQSDGVRFVRQAGDATVFEVGSGTYDFAVK